MLKIGDKVKMIKSHNPNYKVGDIGKIVEVNPFDLQAHYKILIHNEDYWFGREDRTGFYKPIFSCCESFTKCIK